MSVEGLGLPSDKKDCTRVLKWRTSSTQRSYYDDTSVAGKEVLLLEMVTNKQALTKDQSTG